MHMQSPCSLSLSLCMRTRACVCVGEGEGEGGEGLRVGERAGTHARVAGKQS
jgi:hypothetical protein